MADYSSCQVRMADYSSCQVRMADYSSCQERLADMSWLLVFLSGKVGWHVFLSGKVGWHVLTSCILVRKGWLTCLLVRKGWLTWLASGTVLIKFQSKMPNLVHFKQSKNFFRRTTIKTRLLKRKTVKNNQKTELYLQLSSKSPATKSSHDTS